jgi:hypothetical protein
MEEKLPVHSPIAIYYLRTSTQSVIIIHSPRVLEIVSLG